MQDAPTSFGPLSYNLEWDGGGERIRLEVTAPRAEPGQILWRVPGPVESATVDNATSELSGGSVVVPTGVSTIEVTRNGTA